MLNINSGFIHLLQDDYLVPRAKIKSHWEVVLRLYTVTSLGGCHGRAKRVALREGVLLSVGH